MMNIIKTLFKHFSIKKKLGVTDIIAFFSYEIYKLVKKKLIPTKEIILPQALPPAIPLIKNKFLSNVTFTSDVIWVSAVVGLSAATLKGLVDMFFSIENTPTIAHKTENPNDFPRDVTWPIEKPDDDDKQKKKFLPLHLCYPVCAESSINKYVIFKQKNEDNFSSVQISRGDVGKIIKKLKDWDEALVDFSIETPIRFQKLDTLSFANQADNEAILIVE